MIIRLWNKMGLSFVNIFSKLPKYCIIFGSWTSRPADIQIRLLGQKGKFSHFNMEKQNIFSILYQIIKYLYWKNLLHFHIPFQLEFFHKKAFWTQDTLWHGLIIYSLQFYMSVLHVGGPHPSDLMLFQYFVHGPKHWQNSSIVNYKRKRGNKTMKVSTCTYNSSNKFCLYFSLKFIWPCHNSYEIWI